MQYEINEQLTIHKAFDLMTRKEAREYYNYYIEQIDVRISYLQNYLLFENIKCNLDYSTSSLIPLWKWYESKIIMTTMSDEEFEMYKLDYPEWVRSDLSRTYLSDFSKGIALDIGMYFAEVLRKNYPEILKWGMITRGKTNFYYQTPVLLGFPHKIEMGPSNLIHVCALRSAREKCDIRLKETYDKWEKYLI